MCGYKSGSLESLDFRNPRVSESQSHRRRPRAVPGVSPGRADACIEDAG